MHNLPYVHVQFRRDGMAKLLFVGGDRRLEMEMVQVSINLGIYLDYYTCV